MSKARAAGSTGEGPGWAYLHPGQGGWPGSTTAGPAAPVPWRAVGLARHCPSPSPRCTEVTGQRPAGSLGLEGGLTPGSSPPTAATDDPAAQGPGGGLRGSLHCPGAEGEEREGSLQGGRLGVQARPPRAAQEAQAGHSALLPVGAPLWAGPVSGGFPEGRACQAGTCLLKAVSEVPPAHRQEGGRVPWGGRAQPESRRPRRVRPGVRPPRRAHRARCWLARRESDLIAPTGDETCPRSRGHVPTLPHHPPSSAS